MLDRFSVRLEARNHTKGHLRSYRVAAGTDLFGDWIVDIRFGRIGTYGQVQRRAVSGSQEARAIINDILR